MKTLIIMSLLLFSTISLSMGQGSPDPVLDNDGNFLSSGSIYYIQPVIKGQGGGITIDATRNQDCPLDVVQSTREDSAGLPLTLTPVNPDGVIRESTDLNIKFLASSHCFQSYVWNLEKYEGQYIVAANGVSGNPGMDTLNNWFKIEKYEDDYKLVFCPKVCDLCVTVCGDIGVTITENGLRRLAISDVPFKVMFKKL